MTDRVRPQGSSREWFEGLARACRIYRDVRVQYRVLTDQYGRVVGDEYMLAKTPKTASRFGFEPYFFRMACADDGRAGARLLDQVARGRLHPSMFAMLLSPKHQADVATGAVRGFPAMDPKAPKPATAADRLGAAFEENLAMDKDVLKTARNAEAHRADAVLAERPHLLEDRKP